MVFTLLLISNYTPLQRYHPTSWLKHHVLTATNVYLWPHNLLWTPNLVYPLRRQYISNVTSPKVTSCSPLKTLPLAVFSIIGNSTPKVMGGREPQCHPRLFSFTLHMQFIGSMFKIWMGSDLLTVIPLCYLTWIIATAIIFLLPLLTPYIIVYSQTAKLIFKKLKSHSITPLFKILKWLQLTPGENQSPDFGKQCSIEMVLLHHSEINYSPPSSL